MQREMDDRHRLALRGRTMCSPLAFRFPEPMLEEIDAIVASRLDRPDRSAVVRELLAEALMARRVKSATTSASA
jgi:Arc/MetJ-type ribon-helix-helix transcriptional regulator